MNLISVKNLTVGYDNKRVLENISFHVEENDFISVVGANGSGKSTLIKAILKQIPPMKGTIVYENHLKQNFIGYMPQETKVDSNFPASVGEIVLSGCLNRLGIKPFYGKQEKNIVQKNLELLNIENLRKKSFSDLSGGQRQKVLLARSLCATHKLLILDEPSNNLDYKSKQDFYDLILKLNKEEGITIIMITHDLENGSLIGNKVLFLSDNGYFFGTTEEYKEKCTL